MLLYRYHSSSSTTSHYIYENPQLPQYHNPKPGGYHGLKTLTPSSLVLIPHQVSPCKNALCLPTPQSMLSTDPTSSQFLPYT